VDQGNRRVDRSADQSGSQEVISQTDMLRRLRAAPEIFARIAEWQGTELALQQRLRSEFPDDVVRGALSLVELRARGAVKFSRASQMWFGRVGLEQSTSEPVARHKAQRFHGSVWDYCSGIGGDTTMLADHCDVIAVDRDPANCLYTCWNAETYGVASRVTAVCADVESLDDRSGLLHIDPDRRPAGRAGDPGRAGDQARIGAERVRPGQRRSLRLEAGSPGLHFLSRLIGEFRGGAIKASPASNFGGKFPTAEIELISLEGECKEATIWFGELAEPGVWRATSLPAGETIAGDPLAAVVPVSPLGRFIFDPDPALVRAGLIDLFASRTGLSRLDDEEEYLTADQAPHSPFAQPFEVLAQLSNNDREIRGYFRGSRVGRLEIKCRRIPIDAEAVRRKLSLTGDDSAVLIFARIGGRARAVVCRRVPA
jgi:hypothetical protein